MPGRHLSLEEKITKLRQLLASLEKAAGYPAKLMLLNAIPEVQEYFKHPGSIKSFLQDLTPERAYTINAIIAIGQGPVIFKLKNTEKDQSEKLHCLIDQLLDIELFYQHMGGIIGYHLAVLTIIINQKIHMAPSFEHTHHLHPEGFDLGHDLPYVRLAVRWGIENMAHMAEMYPVGGAGDRLNLADENTGNPLPVALLPFLGHTLLEGLIRDLQAREYLYFKLYVKQIVTPLAVMTSVEKNNHIHIFNICKKTCWFGRPSDSFYFFTQPQAPVITIEGNWSLSAPLTLTLKPGGHGVIWKLAEEAGVFASLEAKGRHQCIVRQINNPLAGTDNALLALAGIGCHDQKAFGFVSCERLLNSAEGINILIETEHPRSYEYRLTNIEYTDFTQRGIEETPAFPKSPFSVYPTNTNILFVDIPSIRNALEKCQIPGQLINMKSSVPYIDTHGHLSYLPGGRLESTMQNIADYIVDQFPSRLTKEERKRSLKAFIIYNERSKTISTTKKHYHPGESPESTPEQAFYDLLTNHYHLLQRCQFRLPAWRKFEEHLQAGPACFFLFHPALGPLYSIIEQKIRHGHMGLGAELQLEIAEVDIEKLQIEGSLLIRAFSPLGTIDEAGLLHYGGESRCTLHQVIIRNQGIDDRVNQSFWDNQILRNESVQILLHEGAEFHAEGVTLEGSFYYEVPAHHRLVIEQSVDGHIIEKLFAIEKPTWHWDYSFDDENGIQLKKIGRG